MNFLKKEKVRENGLYKVYYIAISQKGLTEQVHSQKGQRTYE